VNSRRRYSYDEYAKSSSALAGPHKSNTLSRRSHLRLFTFGLFEASSSVQASSCALVELQRASFSLAPARQP